MFRAFSENRLVFMTSPAPEVTPTADAPTEAAPSEPKMPQQLFDEGKRNFEGKVAGAKELVTNLKSIYVDEKYGIDKDTTKDPALTTLFANLDTQLTELTTKFGEEVGKITDATQENLTALETNLYTNVVKELEGEKTDTLDTKIKEKTATTLGVEIKKVTDDLTTFAQKQEEEKKAASESAEATPKYEVEMANTLLQNKESGTYFDAKKVLDGRGKDFSILASEGGYPIHMSVKPGDPATASAKLVMDYTKAQYSQEFADKAAFKKFYGTINEADLPEPSKPAKSLTDVCNLPASKPPPFGGVKRTRELSVSVAADGKVKVEVKSIKFGEPPTPTIEIDLGKPIDQIKTVDDVLYPPGYGKGKRSGTETGTADGAAVMAVESAETQEAKWQRYKAELTKYETAMNKGDFANSPAFAELPVFLRKTLTADHINAKITEANGLLTQGNTLDAAGISHLDTVMTFLEKREGLILREQNFNLGDLPEFSEWKSIKEKGLQYGAGGKDIVDFQNHFSGAANTLHNHFEKKGATSNAEAFYVELTGAKLNFHGEQKSKNISGVFEIKVKGYEGKPIPFAFSGINPTDGQSWETAVSKAMDLCVQNDKMNDLVKDQVRDKEHMERTRRVVAEREARHEEKRDRKAAKAQEKGETFDEFSIPDYEGNSQEDIVEQIGKEYGKAEDYEIKQGDGEWVAVRKSNLVEKTVPARSEVIGTNEGITIKIEADAAVKMKELGMKIDGGKLMVNGAVAKYPETGKEIVFKVMPEPTTLEIRETDGKLVITEIFSDNSRVNYKGSTADALIADMAKSRKTVSAYQTEEGTILEPEVSSGPMATSAVA